MVFGQLVIGPPGSGKTTYCRGIRDYLRAKGRDVRIVNLDPANDALPYAPDVDLSDLIQVQDVMERLRLGPNGALVYCMEFLEKNFAWLKERLEQLPASAATATIATATATGKSAQSKRPREGPAGTRAPGETAAATSLNDSGVYLLFDCPGQVELYTHNNAVQKIVHKLEKQLSIRLVSVHLVDSHYCSDPFKFISVLLTSLTTMLQIELPHVNVLSKIDLIEKYGRLAFNLDFYADVMDLSKLLEHLKEDPFSRKFQKLNAALCELVEDYSLVAFSTLNIQEAESIAKLMKAVDKANGYVYGVLSEGNEAIFEVATQADFQYTKYLDDQEKYLANFDDNNDDGDDDEWR